MVDVPQAFVDIFEVVPIIRTVYRPFLSDTLHRLIGFLFLPACPIGGIRGQDLVNEVWSLRVIKCGPYALAGVSLRSHY